MSFKKKLSIGLSVCFTMIVALIIGFNLPKNDVKGGGNTTPPPPQDEVVNIDKVTNYTYKAEDILLQAGDDTIDYSYQPISSTTTAPTTAYEYSFGNPMDVEMAVYLKSIDVTGVTVAYAYMDTKWDGVTSINGSEYYTTQSIPVGDSDKYIYVLVTPEDGSVPITFNTSVKWNYGRAQTITIGSNIDNTPITQTIVSGQEIEELTYEELTKPSEENEANGYYFDAWFLDEDYTQLATFPLISYGQPLYARFANLPQNVTTYTTYSDDAYTLAVDPEIADLIVPTYYNDGTNGVANITVIADNIFIDWTGSSVNLPSTIITIGVSAFQYSTVNVNLTSCVNLTTIGMSAFNGCSTTSVDLTNCINLTTIGTEAFSSCNITSIDLSNCTKLTSIEEANFYQCSKLASIKFPNTITSISSRAFMDCSQLTNITLPSSVTSILSMAFYNCNGLETISIPSGVTSIGDDTFYYCSGLESIDLSGCTSLTSIGGSAFRGCTNLKQITIPKNVTSIGSDAFNGCVSLIGVVLPKGLTTLGAYAFNKCSELRTINLGDTVVESIGDYTFYECSNLTNISIPSSMTSIGKYAFAYCSNITSIGDLTMCTNLATIGGSAFNNCTNLTSIGAGKFTTLTSIGDYAFAFCSSMTGVVDLDGCINLTTINMYAFIQCAITGIILPQNLTTIGTLAFYNCDCLTNLVIPASVISIASSSFSACSRLTSVTILSSALTIDSQAFDYCYALAEVYNLSSLSISKGSTSAGYVAYYAKVVHKSLDETTRIQTIGNMQYYVYEDDFIALVPAKENISSITLDSRTTAIQTYAFFRYYSLTNIDLSKCVNLTTIGKSAFYYCTGLTSITLPSNLTTIQDEAFRHCYALAEIYNLSSSLNIVAGDTTSANGYISEYAKVIHTSSTTTSIIQTINNVKYYINGTQFIALAVNDKMVTSITLDSRTTEINSGAFAGCSNLTSMEIPQGVANIGKSAFSNCTSLINIDLTKCTNLTNIDSNAFEYCESLTSIIIPSSVANIGKYAFQNCDKLATIIFPTGLISIGDSAFRYCSSLTSVDLAICTNLASIGTSAFFYCSNLTTVTVPSSITTIEYGVFHSCKNLTTIDLSGCTNLTSIGDSAFYYCSKLTNIIIPINVTKIGYQAFKGCGGGSITFKDTTTWYYGTKAQQDDMSGGTPISVTKTGYNAVYLTSTYASYYWYKV